MEQFVLFGDSITQGSAYQDRGFAFTPALQDAYMRRLDVINRGFNGYNTAQALKVLPRVLPSPEHARVRLMAIFFGANDARLPNTPGFSQTVSLEQYTENLIKIATHPAVQAHKPQIILITPPPVDERLCIASDGTDVVRRTAANTAIYAEAVRQVGKKLNAPVLDLWSAFMKAAGWKAGEPLPGSRDVPQNEVLVKLMYDGLHFNPEGYKILFAEMMRLIETEIPADSPDAIPSLLPRWDDAAAWLE